MAISNNVLTHGLSGKIGDLIVFRQAGGKALVFSAPKQQTKPPTESQKEQQRRFQQAVIYAKAAGFRSRPPTCPETSPPKKP